MKPACGRADLVRALASGDPELLRATAEILGFAAPAAEPRHEEATKHRAQLRDGSEIERAPAVLSEPRSLVDIPFWRLESYTAVAEGGEPETPVGAPPVIWTNRPVEPPRFRLLSPWRELQPRLRRAATENREGQAVDMAAVVRCLSEGRLMDCLPRERRRRWGLQLQLIVDRSERLVPFWADQDAVRHRLARLLPPHAIELTAVWEGLSAPRVLTETWSESTYRPPPPGSLVLVLGDLGGLAPGDLQAHHLWLDLGRNLAEGGCRPVALIPCPLGRCPNDLRRYWVLLPWERPRGGAVTDRTRLRQRAERLLRLVSPAVRIEPGFLRAVRLLLPAGEADAGTEADAWQHPAVISTSVEGATLDPEAAKALRAAFAQESPELQRQVLALLRVWRGQLPQEIWFEEIECLAPASRALLPELEDLTLARDFFVQLSQQARGVLPGRVAAGALSWYRRCERRVIPSRADPAAAEAMHKLSWALHRNEPGYLPAAGFDPAWAPATRERRLVVRQRGETLVFTEQMDPGVVAEGPGSPLAMLRSANGLIHIEALPAGPDRNAFWKGERPPPWAADWGTDEFGHWVTFTVEGKHGERVVQRLRWILPGTFLMGSPVNEPERQDREGPQHQVTISEGFWLFDTACTQALWEAVMGENLSRFQGADRPVESVNWHDCQRFIQRLNERLLGFELQLPTEAQWEYACRAGTQTPFSFGANITPEQVNYDGRYPYAGAKEGLFRGETVPVASLPPNPWGLYEMHGNIDEWCRDDMRTYRDEAETDPLGPLEAGVERVVRGGSWSHYARRVRAAYRFQRVPGYRRDFLGFRCARVQAGAEPAGPGPVRQAERRTAQDMPGRATLVRLDDSVREARCPILQGGGLLIRSDRESLTFGFRTKPSWAAAMGRDRYGLWAEIALDTGQGESITQRLRWLPPGRFRMGSPCPVSRATSAQSP